MTGTATHCPYCGLQCAMRVSAAGEVGPREFPTNRGGLCHKGWTSAALLTHPDRLTAPLVRVDGELRPATWDLALDTVVDGIRRAQDAGGRDAVAVFGSGGLTNEKAYQLGKFARVALRTANIDYNGRFCMSSAAAAGTAAFGVDRGLPFPVADLTGAAAVLLWGANVAETMPPLAGHFTGTLIVVDPRRTPTAQRALDGGGLHLQLAPGTDLALALGLMHLAVLEGHLDREYLERRTTGFSEAWLAASHWWPARAERVTGVPVDQMRRAVEMLWNARQSGTGSYILTARGAEQHASGTDTVAAVIALALTLGLPGRPGSGYGCLTGQGNGQGGREHGLKADQLPGYRKITDPAARAHVAGVWGVEPEELPGPGPSAYVLLDALGRPDGPRALLVHGSNPAVSAPRAGHIAERLAALDLLVVCDLVLSETAAMADVVLPVLQWAEEEGTMTSLEGRVLRRRRATAPPEGARGELWVLAELARRLGRDGFASEPGEVFEELRRASAGGPADYAGVSYARLDAGEALHWPCPDEAHPGTPRMFLDRFATPDGRARFRAVEHRGPVEAFDAQYPLTATTGRVLAQYQSGAQTRRVPELAAAAGGMFVQVHPDTARRAGLVHGDAAAVISRRGEVRAAVRCDETMRLDTVFLPFHFPGAERANLMTNPALDPTSSMPEFKACAIRLEPT